MGRYIDENDVYDLVGSRGMSKVHCSQIDALPRADVISKEFLTRKEDEAYERGYKDGAKELDYTLTGVMHSVDKWLEGDELKQDEVNRAITMREKTLQLVESVEDAKIKAKFEVLEELEERIATHAFTSKSEDYADGAYDTVAWVDSKIDELKLKYSGR